PTIFSRDWSSDVCSSYLSYIHFYRRHTQGKCQKVMTDAYTKKRFPTIPYLPYHIQLMGHFHGIPRTPGYKKSIRLKIHHLFKGSAVWENHHLTISCFQKLQIGLLQP